MTASLRHDVVVLCGGQGTRLRAAVPDRPKAMALIDGRPFLDILLDHAVGEGARRLILCVGYRADAIIQHVADRRDCHLVVSPEQEPLDTAGAIRQALGHIESDPFVVVNGDSYCPLSYRDLVAFHRRSQAVGTLALAAAGNRRDGGIVTVDGDGRVLRFDEKPSGGTSGVINAGVYVFSRRAFASLPVGRPISLEQEVLPSLIPHLAGMPISAPLYDIGTPERLQAFASFHAAHRTGDDLSSLWTAGAGVGSRSAGSRG